MKKVFSCLLVALMIASMLVMSVGAAIRADGLNHDYGSIANVERKSVRLDAVRDAAYDVATPIPVNTLSANTDAAKLAEGRVLADAVAYVVYDSEYIWVFVEVNDTTLVTKAAGPLQSSYKEDSIELVFDFGQLAVNEGGVSPWQSRLTHEGYISARIGQSGKTLQGTYDQGATDPVDWLDGFAVHREDGTGYNCEFKVSIPSADVVTIGDTIGMNIMINDYDENGGSRAMITSNSTDPASDQWKADLYGNITFDDSAPYTADMTIVYVAIAMAAALLVGTATVVSMKKRAK